MVPRTSPELEAKRQNVSSINQMAEIALASLASEFCERITAQIRAFEANLDQEHEVGAKLVTFGQAMTFHLLDVGYHNPSLIFFHGETDDGDRVTLVQNVSQISFLLIAMPKAKPEAPPRRFGFAQGHADHDNPAE